MCGDIWVVTSVLLSLVLVSGPSSQNMIMRGSDESRRCIYMRRMPHYTY